MTNRAGRQVHAAATGAQLTLSQARALRDDPPQHLTDKQKAKLTAWIDQREAATRAKQTERYKAVRELLTDRRKAMAGDIEELNEYVAEVKQGLDNGRLTSAKGQEALTAAFKEIRKIRERIEGTRTDESRAWNFVNTDPADFEQEQLTRFPTLGATLPRLSVADLDGDG